MGFKKWVLPELDKDNAGFLAGECGIEPFTALISTVRGYTDSLELDMFLSAEVIETEPFDFTDMDKAVEIIEKFVSEKKKITIFGDYDCDGITSAVILYDYLKSVGADVTYYIPSRLNEGYGMSLSAIDNIKNSGTELIITVDNGISAAEEIKYAGERGITVVVTDHHRQNGDIPSAAAVVDPHRNDSTMSFTDFAGVGVAFFLVCALSGSEPELILERYSELLTLGTVADVMPLTGDNRTFVRRGLEIINSHPPLWITSLLRASSSNQQEISVGVLSFTLAPRINAAGRMSDPNTAAELLLETDENKSVQLATQLNNLNSERQKIEQDILLKALEKVESERLYSDRVIIVTGEGWHEGVIGISAARIAEKYSKPVILISKDIEKGIGKGSARSVGKFSIFDAIESCSALLKTFGGHALAAGLTLNIENIDEFRKTINENSFLQSYPVPEICIDCKLNPSVINTDLVEALVPLEPFGVGNPAPLFGLFGLKIERIMPLAAGKRIKIIASKGNNVIALLMFGTQQNKFRFKTGSTVDAIVSLKCQQYNGEKQVSVIVKDIRRAGINDDETVLSLENYSEIHFDKRNVKAAKSLMFGRNEMAEVYKAVRNGINSVESLFEIISDIPLGKINIIVDVLEELGLIDYNNNGQESYIEITESEKTVLENSKIYCKIKELSEGDD